MSVPSSSSEPSPNTTPSPSDPYPDHTVERTGLIYPLCAAVLCERWAASTLISTGATMLCERYGFSRPDSLRMWGLLSAVCYVGAVPGGYLLDRTCSPSRGLSGSLLLLVLGYVVLSMPFRAAVLVGFALLALGQSLYKPSTQRVLSSLFPSTNSRLERAQILLHIAINLGAAAGSFLAGILLRKAGWGITYALAALVAGIGMALSQTTQRHRKGSDAASKDRCLTSYAALAPGSLFTISAMLISMFVLAVTSAQIEGALLLWTAQHTSRLLLGVEIPTAWLITYAALLVLLLSPFQLVFLRRFTSRTLTHRFVASGLVAAALCFAILLPTTRWPGNISIAWPLFSVTLFVFAEILIAPLGLAQLLRSTPKRLTGIVTGLWYGAGALGYLVGGHIGALWSKWPTQRVLILLSVLPLLGAAIVWHARPGGDQGSET